MIMRATCNYYTPHPMLCGAYRKAKSIVCKGDGDGHSLGIGVDGYKRGDVLLLTETFVLLCGG